MAEMVSNTTSLSDEQVRTFCEAHMLSTVNAWVTVQFAQQLCSRASTTPVGSFHLAPSWARYSSAFYLTMERFCTHHCWDKAFLPR